MKMHVLISDKCMNLPFKHAYIQVLDHTLERIPRVFAPSATVLPLFSGRLALSPIRRVILMHKILRQCRKQSNRTRFGYRTLKLLFGVKSLLDRELLVSLSQVRLDERFTGN